MLTNDIEKARKGIFVVLAEAGIKSRDDRLELASDILDKNIDSFTEMNEDDILDLHFALQSWKRIQNVRSANGSLLREAEIIVSETHDIDMDSLPKRHHEEVWDAYESIGNRT